MMDTGGSSPGGYIDHSSRGGGYSGSVSPRQQVDPFEAADWSEKRKITSKHKRVDDIISDGNTLGKSNNTLGAGAGATSATNPVGLVTGGISASSGFGALTPAAAPATSAGAFGLGTLAKPAAAPAATLGLGFGATAAPAPPSEGLVDLAENGEESVPAPAPKTSRTKRVTVTKSTTTKVASSKTSRAKKAPAVIEDEVSSRRSGRSTKNTRKIIEADEEEVDPENSNPQQV